MRSGAAAEQNRMELVNANLVLLCRNFALETKNERRRTYRTVLSGDVARRTTIVFDIGGLN